TTDAHTLFLLPHTHSPKSAMLSPSLFSLPLFPCLYSHTGTLPVFLPKPLSCLSSSPPSQCSHHFPKLKPPVRHSLLLLFLLPPPAPLFIHIQKHTRAIQAKFPLSIRSGVVCYNLIIATLLRPSFLPLHLSLPCVVPPLNPQIPTPAKENKSPLPGIHISTHSLGQLFLAIASTPP
ncbi:unnamed protein product, partial [Tuber aestivum]